MAVDFTSGLSGGDSFGTGGTSGGSIMSMLRKPSQQQQGLGDPDYSIGRAGTQSQFPEAAAYERLAQNRQQADRVARSFETLGIKIPDSVERIRNEGYEPEEPGVAEKVVGAIAGNPIGKGALTALNWAGGLSRLVQTGLKEVTGTIRGQEKTGQFGDLAGWDIFHTVFGSPEDMEEILMRTGIDVTSGSQLLGMWGWEEQETGLAKTTRFGAHAFMEIVTDPFSYISAGGGAVGRKALGEAGDAAARKVVREAVEGVGSTAAHDIVRSNYDLIGEELFGKIMAGDNDAFAKVFAGIDPKKARVLKEQIRAGGYDVQEGLADSIDNFLIGDVMSDKPGLIAPGQLLQEARDQVVGPLISKDFASIPDEWLEHLPAYARGGMRIIRPWSMTQKGLQKGFQLPGTRGLGRTIWENSGQRLTKALGESKFPFSNSKTVYDVLGSVRKGTDYYHTLVKAVKDNKITGGEYMIIQDALNHNVTKQSLDALVPRLLFQQQDMMDEFHSFLDTSASKSLKESLPKPGIAGAEARDMQINRNKTLAQGLYQFITDEGDNLRFGGELIPKESSLYKKAMGFRTEARTVMNEYNEAIKRAVPEYTDGIENYLPFAINREQRAFLQQLATKAPQVAEQLQKSGMEGGADYFVGHLLNSVSFGGVAEASIGSSAHLNARTFSKSPVVSLFDETPLLMVDKSLADGMKEVMEYVEAGHIGAVQLNDIMEGKLKELAKQHNVPLPKHGIVRMFDEDPFNLINAYAHSMEQTLRHRNAIEIMKNYGLASGIDTQLAVQRTLSEIESRLSNPKLIERFEKISERVEAWKRQGIEPKVGIPLEKSHEVAHHIRGKMTVYDEDGWVKRLYDNLSPEEKVDNYVGSDDMAQVTAYRGWTPKHSGRSNIPDAHDPLENLQAIRRKEYPDLDLETPSNVHDVKFETDGRVKWQYTDPNTGETFKRVSKDTWEWKSNMRDIAHRQQEVFDVTFPQVIHMGPEATQAHFATNIGDVSTKIKLKKGANIYPDTLGDQAANFVQKAWDDWIKMGYPDDDMIAAYTNMWNKERNILEQQFGTFENFYDTRHYDAVRYVNGGEASGVNSWVVMNADAIDYTQVVDKTEPVAWFDIKKNKWSEGQTTESTAYVLADISLSNPKHKMYVDGLENMSQAEKAHIQREAIRFAIARDGDYIQLYGTASATPLWEGSAKAVYNRIEDSTALKSADASLQRVVHPNLSHEEDLVAQAAMVSEVARLFRRKAKKRGAFGSKGARQFDPDDTKQLAKWEGLDLTDDRLNVAVYGDADGNIYHTIDQAHAEYGNDWSLKTFLIAEGRTQSTNKRAMHIARGLRQDTMTMQDLAKTHLTDELFEKAVADIRWLAKKTGKAELHYNRNPFDTFKSIDINVERLDQYVDWDQVSDNDVWLAALDEVNGVRVLEPDTQKAFLSWARQEYGPEFVAEAMRTTKDIVETEVLHARFIDTVERLMKFGRGADGQILDETTFLAEKGDPFASLLETARKQAKAIGIDPDTFEPVATTIHNQTYKFVHPITGETVERNLVNPRLFGLGGPALEGEQLAVEVAEWFAQVTDNAMSLYTPIGFATFKENINQATRWWKSMATVTRPTFHIRNAVGGIWNNQVIGVGARDYATVRNGAIKIRNRMDKGASIAEAIEGLSGRQQKVFRAAFEEGLFGNSFAVAEIKAGKRHINTKAAGALKSVNPLSLDGPGVKFGGNMMETIEDFLRMSAFAAWFDPDNPATAKVAREMAYASQFDYKHLTKFETSVKQFVPFFVWQRRNIPLQLQVLAERPGLMTRYAHLMEAANENFGSDEGQGADLATSQYLTAFVADTGIVLNEDTPFWTRIMLDPKIPPVDLFETFDSMNPLEIISHFGDNFHPLYTAAMDFQQQKDFGDVNAPAPINVVMSQLARWGLFDESIDGDVQIPYYMRTLFNAMAPFAPEYSQVTEGIGQAVMGANPEQDPKRLAGLGIATQDDPDSPLVNGLTALGLTFGKGLGVTTQTPRDTAGPAYGASEEITDILNNAFQNIPGFADAYEDQLRR